jgi:hypothetical protein
VTVWTDEELRRVGEAEELQLASRRGDGTLRPYGEPGVHAGIDAAYHAKYGPAIVGSVVGDTAVPVTIRLVPSS